MKNHITRLNAEAKNQASNLHILEFWVVFTVSPFVGNPVCPVYFKPVGFPRKHLNPLNFQWLRCLVKKSGVLIFDIRMSDTKCLGSY